MSYLAIAGRSLCRKLNETVVGNSYCSPQTWGATTGIDKMIALDVSTLLAGAPVPWPSAEGLSLRRLWSSDHIVLRDFRAEIVESTGNPDVIRPMPTRSSTFRSV